jgi:glycerol-3-phosphate dehydrogenase (NAD+)
MANIGFSYLPQVKFILLRYLPGIQLPSNIVACPDVVKSAEGATLLVFVIPHQFVKSTCDKIKHVINPAKTRVISLIKGVDVAGDSTSLLNVDSLHLISSMIHKQLGGLDVSVLMVLCA